MDKIIYLDNSATTCPLDEVNNEYVNAAKLFYGNPSSLHRLGVEAERLLEKCRSNIATGLAAKSEEIYFTGSGTEADNLALLGVCYANKKFKNRLVTTTIEHPAVLNTCAELERQGFEVSYIGVDSNGNPNLEQLNDVVDEKTVLVSMMAVNNEVGNVLPLKQAGEIVKKKSPQTLFHIDAVQALGKIPISVKDLNADLLSVSAHKIHGPKGIGALFVRKGVKIHPLVFGGNQEKGLRSGTTNLPAIAGFSKAVELLDVENDSKHMIHLRQALENEISNMETVKINGVGAINILNVSFMGIRAEVLLHTLESYGIMVSTGSACTSKTNKASHVLKAMRLKPGEAESALRFSFSSQNTLAEVMYCADVLKKEVKNLKKFTRR